MFRRTLILALVLSAPGAVSMAQPGFMGFGAGYGGQRSGHGFFPGFGGWSRPPMLRPPDRAAGLHFMNPMFWRGSRDTRVSNRGPRFFGSYVYGWAGYERPKLYSSEYFVQHWADRPPAVQPVGQSQLSRSLVLSRGMDEEAVVRLLGSPLERIRLEEREIWKYSGYSLVFESGILTDIR